MTPAAQDDERRAERRRLEGALQAWSRGANQPNAIRLVDITRIESFEGFLLAELPYGKIEPALLTQGVIETFGMDDVSDVRWIEIACDPQRYNKVLHWQFGARTYPIARAVRIQYEYSNQYVQEMRGSLLVGYQAPSIEAKDNLGDPVQRLEKIQDRKAKLDSSEVGQVIAHLLNKASGDLVQSSPTTITTGYAEFLAQQSPYTNGTSPTTAQDKVKRTAEAFKEPDSVEFCGIARDNSSLNPYTASWGTISADSALYEQLLHWRFGPVGHRVTKAIRVQYKPRSAANPDAPLLPPALFIGYQGPGHY